VCPRIRGTASNSDDKLAMPAMELGSSAEQSGSAMVALASEGEKEYVVGGLTLCKEQLAELREIFARFDRDKDGSITELELGLMLRSLGLKPEGHQLDALLQRADTNSNGMVEFAEFVALVGPQLVKTEAFNDKELLTVFRAFDRDGNGFITAAELAHSMAKLGQALSVKELWTMIREADSDGDGRISFPEFAAAMMSASSLDIPLH
jgi:calcium-binding protein CML